MRSFDGLENFPFFVDIACGFCIFCLFVSMENLWIFHILYHMLCVYIVCRRWIVLSLFDSEKENTHTKTIRIANEYLR